MLYSITYQILAEEKIIWELLSFKAVEDFLSDPNSLNKS